MFNFTKPNQLSLYVVTNEESLWVDSVGSFIHEWSKEITLDIDGEKIIFDRGDVERIL